MTHLYLYNLLILLGGNYKLFILVYLCFDCHVSSDMNFFRFWRISDYGFGHFKYVPQGSKLISIAVVGGIKGI